MGAACLADRSLVQEVAPRLLFDVDEQNVSPLTPGAQPDCASDDKAAIRATITDYIESYYLNDAARRERSLHPHYLKQTIDGSNGELTITDKTGIEMVREVRNKEEITPCVGTKGRD